MIRVMLADDHAAIRMGLEELLRQQADLDFVGAAANGLEAVALAATAEPDVVLMDLSMPELGGLEATRRILAARPETRVVILTTFSDRKDVLEAIDAGAVGYLLKDGDLDEVVRGIRAAAAGDSPLAPRAAQVIVSARMNRRPVDILTKREREVLVLVAEGMLNKQIAQRLGITEPTVKAHLTSLFQRIGVTDRTQAALWAERNGVLPPDDA